MGGMTLAAVWGRRWKGASRCGTCREAPARVQVVVAWASAAPRAVKEGVSRKVCTRMESPGADPGAGLGGLGKTHEGEEGVKKAPGQDSGLLREGRG